MANYVSHTRTNYFHVTNIAEFKELMSHCTGEDEVYVFEERDPEGEFQFAFGVYGSFYGYDTGNEDAEIDEQFNEFAVKLQALLRPDDACIIYNAGSEKLRYVGGVATIITRDKIDSVSLIKAATQKTRELLDDPAWETKSDY